MSPFFVFIIIVALILVHILLNKFYFRKKNYGVANDSLRFLALFFDLMLFNILVFGGGFLYFLYRGEVKSHVLAYIEVVVNKTGYGKLREDWLMLEIKIFAFYFVYAIIMESFSKEGTLGKRFVKIEFEQKLGFFRVVLRNIVKVISLVFWPVLILFSRRSKDRKWPHDIVVGSKIIKK